MLDAQELPVSAASASDLAAIDAFTAGLLAMEGGLDGILSAAKTSPGCPLLQIDAAIFFLYAGTQKGVETARQWLDRAEPLLTQAHPREQRLYHASTLWADNDIESAMDALEGISADWPGDLVAVKACEFLYYLGGQHCNAKRYLKHLEHVSGHHPQNPDVLAMHAFSLELNAHYERARERAEEAIDHRFACAWAHHALAHTTTVTDDLERGRREQERFLPTWNQPIGSIHGHNAWHLALLRLLHQDASGALDLFRTHIWGHLPESPGEHVDAVSLLWRMEMAGNEVEASLWSAVAEACLPLAGEALNPFVSAHHAHAFARAGMDDAVTHLQAAITDAAQHQPPERRAVWAHAGVPVVEAAIAWGKRESENVIRHLEGVVDQIPKVGGSDAQDDVFRITLVHALIAVGRHDAAHQLLSQFPGKRAFSNLI